MVGGVFDLRRQGRKPAKSAMGARACTRSVQALRNARSGRRSSPPGPVRRPRGYVTAVSPSPLDPVQRADPRRIHGSVSTVAGEERTGGRTATHQEHTTTLRTSPRTTIPPSGTMPLNAWDAANYAGFTNAAWLCQ